MIKNNNYINQKPISGTRKPHPRTNVIGNPHPEVKTHIRKRS